MNIKIQQTVLKKMKKIKLFLFPYQWIFIMISFVKFN